MWRILIFGFDYFRSADSATSRASCNGDVDVEVEVEVK